MKSRFKSFTSKTDTTPPDRGYRHDQGSGQGPGQPPIFSGEGNVSGDHHALHPSEMIRRRYAPGSTPGPTPAPTLAPPSGSTPGPMPGPTPQRSRFPNGKGTGQNPMTISDLVSDSPSPTPVSLTPVSPTPVSPIPVSPPAPPLDFEAIFSTGLSLPPRPPPVFNQPPPVLKQPPPVSPQVYEPPPLANIQSTRQRREARQTIQREPVRPWFPETETQSVQPAPPVQPQFNQPPVQQQVQPQFNQPPVQQQVQPQFNQPAPNNIYYDLGRSFGYTPPPAIIDPGALSSAATGVGHGVVYAGKVAVDGVKFAADGIGQGVKQGAKFAADGVKAAADGIGQGVRFAADRFAADGIRADATPADGIRADATPADDIRSDATPADGIRADAAQNVAQHVRNGVRNAYKKANKAGLRLGSTQTQSCLGNTDECNYECTADEQGEGQCVPIDVVEPPPKTRQKTGPSVELFDESIRTMFPNGPQTAEDRLNVRNMRKAQGAVKPGTWFRADHMGGKTYKRRPRKTRVGRHKRGGRKTRRKRTRRK